MLIDYEETDLGFEGTEFSVVYDVKKEKVHFSESVFSRLTDSL